MVEMPKEIYDKVASEISEATVSIWANDLETCEDGITIDALWDILRKYIKPVEDGNDEVKVPWDFVERYYPKYSSSDEIAHEGDLHKLVAGEYEEGDCAHELLKDEYGGNILNPLIEIDHKIALCEIYEKAIEAYIEQQKR